MPLAVGSVSNRARVDLAAAAIYAEVAQGTVWKWVRRGHLSQHRDGYDLDEIDAWLARRDTGKAVGGALAAHSRHQSSRSARAGLS